MLLKFFWPFLPVLFLWSLLCKKSYWFSKQSSFSNLESLQINLIKKLLDCLGETLFWYAFGSFMVIGRHTKIEEWLIGHIIANTFSNFFVPMYYIYTTPNLNKYVKSFFVQPSICRSNQVLPSVHFQNTSNTVVIQGVFNWDQNNLCS